jgi:hypothetical protein
MVKSPMWFLSNSFLSTAPMTLLRALELVVQHPSAPNPGRLLLLSYFAQLHVTDSLLQQEPVLHPFCSFTARANSSAPVLQSA